MSPHDHEHVKIEEGCLVINLPVATTFDLEKVVCNHGFFMMAPNEWVATRKTLRRPLHLANSRMSILVSISQLSSDSLTIVIHRNDEKGHITQADEEAVKKQVARMLRISEKDEKEVKEFQQMHLEAKEKGFGRLFRSPSVFEDAVKTILLLNIPWHRSLEMAQALCNLQLKLRANCSKSKSNKEMRKSSGKRKERGSVMVLSEANKRIESGSSLGDVKKDMASLVPGNFPSSRELACLSTDDLKSCKLGYRADRIINLAKMVEDGKLNLDQLEMATNKTVYKKLMKIKGFGGFSCATLMMCIGFYDRVPTDSETIRHLKEVHDTDVSSKRRIEEGIKRLYDKYSPFQCLAYWFDLLQYYESRFGKLSELPRSQYHRITGSFKAEAINFEGND